MKIDKKYFVFECDQKDTQITKLFNSKETIVPMSASELQHEKRISTDSINVDKLDSKAKPELIEEPKASSSMHICGSESNEKEFNPSQQSQDSQAANSGNIRETIIQIIYPNHPEKQDFEVCIEYSKSFCHECFSQNKDGDFIRKTCEAKHY